MINKIKNEKIRNIFFNKLVKLIIHNYDRRKKPIFEKKNKKKLTYLDSANSSQKPKSVIEKLSQFYSYDFKCW